MRAIGDLAFLLDDEEVWREKAVEAGGQCEFMLKVEIRSRLGKLPSPIGLRC